MANVILGWRPYETQFLGDKVTVQLKPLKNWAMLKVLPYMESFRAEDTNAQLKAMFEVQALAAEVFPEHVQNIQGLTVDGEVPTIEQLATETALYPLTVDIMSELVTIGQLTTGDEKNSDSPSDMKEPGGGTQTPFSG